MKSMVCPLLPGVVCVRESCGVEERERKSVCEREREECVDVSPPPCVCVYRLLQVVC